MSRVNPHIIPYDVQFTWTTGWTLECMFSFTPPLLHSSTPPLLSSFHDPCCQHTTVRPYSLITTRLFYILHTTSFLHFLSFFLTLNSPIADPIGKIAGKPGARYGASIASAGIDVYLFGGLGYGGPNHECIPLSYRSLYSPSLALLFDDQ